MIVKIKLHKRPVYGGLLKYMLNDKARLFDKEKRSFAISHNLKGNSIAEWAKQFKANEQYRLRKRSDSVLISHEILSWHRDDAKHITLTKMEAMAREYIRQRNPKGMYVAVPHFDKNHYHIHICAAGIEFKTGKSLRLSKQDLLKLKNGIQQFQIEHFPELSKSVVEHGKRSKAISSEKEYQVKLRTGRESGKEHLISVLNSCYTKAKSKESFFQLLKQSGLTTYERGGKMTGVVHDNYKFRFSRLGFSEEQFEDLNRMEEREVGLKKARNKMPEKRIQRHVHETNSNSNHSRSYGFRGK